MTDELLDDTTAFLQMARDFPVRTGIFTFGLPVFALLQFINGYVHQGSLLFIGAFLVLMVLFSVWLTRYQVAAYRRARLERGILEKFEDAEND
jgi:hypothetical protein